MRGELFVFLVDKHYTISDVERLTGIKRHSLDYYARTNIFPPSISAMKNERGKRKKYSVLDILVLQVVGDLKAKGMPFKRIRDAIEYLRENHNLDKPFHAALDGRHNVRILTDCCNSFYICFSDHEVVEHLKGGGQYMLLDVSDTAFELKERIRALQLYKRKKVSRRFQKLHLSDAV